MPKTDEPMSDADYDAQRKRLAAETARRQKAAAEEKLAPLKPLLDLIDAKSKQNLDDTLAAASAARDEVAVVQDRTIFPHLDAFVRSGELLRQAIQSAKQQAESTPPPDLLPAALPAD